MSVGVAGATAWLQWLAVALGGAVGSVLRWRVAVWLNNPGHVFPLGTLAVNCVGGLLIGMAVAWFDRVPDELWRLLLITGLLGGLTTFSSFSAESLSLLQRGHWSGALWHSFAHVAGGLGFAALGHWLMRLSA